jgi:hypothetical protein
MKYIAASIKARNCPGDIRELQAAIGVQSGKSTTGFAICP